MWNSTHEYQDDACTIEAVRHHMYDKLQKSSILNECLLHIELTSWHGFTVKIITTVPANYILWISPDRSKRTAPCSSLSTVYASYNHLVNSFNQVYNLKFTLFFRVKFVVIVGTHWYPGAGHPACFRILTIPSLQLSFAFWENLPSH